MASRKADALPRINLKNVNVKGLGQRLFFTFCPVPNCFCLALSCLFGKLAPSSLAAALIKDFRHRAQTDRSNDTDPFRQREDSSQEQKGNHCNECKDDDPDKGPLHIHLFTPFLQLLLF